MFHWKKYFSISSTKFFFFDKVVSSKLRLGEDDRLWVTSFRKLLMTTNDTEHFPRLRNVGWISNSTFRCGCFVQLMRINLKTSPKSLIPPKYRLNSWSSATIVWQTIVSSHYSDVLMGTIASQITSQLFTQPFIQTQIKENIKAPRHWPLCGGIHRGPVNSPHKWPVTRKMFPFHDVIMMTLRGVFRFEVQHIEAETKWPPYFRRHHFSKGNCYTSIQILLKCVRKGTINNKPSLIQIMAWC